MTDKTCETCWHRAVCYWQRRPINTGGDCGAGLPHWAAQPSEPECDGESGEGRRTCAVCGRSLGSKPYETCPNCGLCNGPGKTPSADGAEPDIFKELDGLIAEAHRRPPGADTGRADSDKPAEPTGGDGPESSEGRRTCSTCAEPGGLPDCCNNARCSGCNPLSGVDCSKRPRWRPCESPETDSDKPASGAEGTVISAPDKIDPERLKELLEQGRKLAASEHERLEKLRGVPDDEWSKRYRASRPSESAEYVAARLAPREDHSPVDRDDFDELAERVERLDEAVKRYGDADKGIWATLQQHTDRIGALRRDVEEHCATAVDVDGEED